MKNKCLLLFALITLASCSKENISPDNPSSVNNSSSNSSSGSSTVSHNCGYPTKNGPCKRRVAGYTGYCWQHK